MALQLHLMGVAHIDKDGTRTVLPFKKAEALVFYLALEGPRPKEKVKCLFWGDKNEHQAAGNLRNAIYILRKHLQGNFEAKQGHLAVTGCTTDLDEILRGNLTKIPTVIFEEPLCGFESLDIEDFTEWLSYKKEEIRERIVRWLKLRLRDVLAAKDTDTRTEYLNALLKLDPFDDESVLELMKLHAASGRLLKALSVYREFSARLRREAGIAPGNSLMSFAKKLSAELSSKNTESINHFCGRENELRQIFESVCHSNGIQLNYICGEPGVGKTAFVNRVINLIASEDTLLFRTSPHPFSESFDYSAWRNIATQLVNLSRDNNIEIGRERLSILTRYFSDFSGEVQFRGTVLLPPEREASVIAGIMAGITNQLSAGRQTILVLEDMHWFDAPSIKLLSFFIAALKVPAIFFMTSRPEGEDAVCELIYSLRPLMKCSVISIRLMPFTKEETADFCRLFISEDIMKERGLDYFFSESSGIPLLLVEMSKMLKENRMVKCRAGLRGLIMGRMKELTERERDVLSVLSVFEGAASAEDIAQAAGLSADDTVGVLEKLLKRQMVRETEENGKFLLEFLHENVRKCVYDAMPKFRSRKLHQKAAEALKKHYSLHRWNPALSEKLKHHYTVSGNDLAVLELCLQEMSFHINLNHTLFPLIQDSVLLKCSLPFSDREETEHKFMIILDILNRCGYSYGNSLSFKKLEASYLEMYGGYNINWGEYEKGRLMTDAGLASARKYGFDETELHCLEDIAHHYLQTDRSTELSECGEEILALAGKLGKENHKGLAFRLIGMSRLIKGDYTGAERIFNESIKLFETLKMTGSPYTLSMLAPHCYIGEMHQWAGESEYAMKRFEYCLDICRSIGLFWGQSHFHAHAADAALDMGDWDLLRSHIEEGVSLFESSQGGHCSSILYSLKAVCDARRGDLPAALTALKKADFLSSIGKRSWCAAQMMAKAWVSMLAEDKLDMPEASGSLVYSAEKYAEEAAILYEAIGARHRADFIKHGFITPRRKNRYTSR